MPNEALVTIAEVSAAFVGFSMVVSVLRSSSIEDTIRAFAIRDVAEIGLIVLAGALGPLAVHLFTTSEAVVWRLCSLVLSFAMLTSFAFSQVRFRKLELTVRENPNPALAFIMIALLLIGNVLLWWNMVSAAGAMSGRYVTALLVFLAIAGGLFVQATFGSESMDRPARQADESDLE